MAFVIELEETVRDAGTEAVAEIGSRPLEGGDTGRATRRFKRAGVALHSMPNTQSVRGRA